MVRRLAWQTAQVVDARQETPTARTLVLDVPDWPGHLAGQHVDVRLTAEDGYRAMRSYSIASAPDGGRVEITVQRLVVGEVSPYLVDGVSVGDRLELRGPVGGWFVWDPSSRIPVLLIAGGSGSVPLIAMIRARAAAGSSARFRLVYSARTLADVLHADELQSQPDGVDVSLVLTREESPAGRPAGRLRLDDLGRPRGPVDVYVCGPTGFVESAATMLVTLGYDEARIRTERFGGGGRP
jgi:ferredoxin-NADP reductase